MPSYTNKFESIALINFQINFNWMSHKHFLFYTSSCVDVCNRSLGIDQSNKQKSKKIFLKCSLIKSLNNMNM